MPIHLPPPIVCELPAEAAGAARPARFEVNTSSASGLPQRSPADPNGPHLPPKVAYPSTSTGGITIHSVDANLDRYIFAEPHAELRRPRLGSLPSS